MRSFGPEEVMPCWYYDRKDLRTSTPSVKDGIDAEVENRYRKEGAEFIMKTGAKMGLRHYETLATGIVYFHRFYMFHSFKHFPRYVTACCCLFLAGKVEETPKKCKDIIKAARALLTDHQFAQFGEDPKVLQEEVMTLERILLQTIKFDLQVEHPYRFILKYAKCLKGDKLKIESMVQMAWTFVNDSLYTTLCLQWEPEIIAIALIYLASKLSKFEVSDWSGRQARHHRWWDMFVENISRELLEDICHQVLDLYSSSGASSSAESPPVTPPPNNRPAASKAAELKQQTQPLVGVTSRKQRLASPGMLHLDFAAKVVKMDHGDKHGNGHPIMTLSRQPLMAAPLQQPPQQSSQQRISLVVDGTTTGVAAGGQQASSNYKYSQVPSVLDQYMQQYGPSPTASSYPGFAEQHQSHTVVDATYSQPPTPVAPPPYLQGYDGTAYASGYHPQLTPAASSNLAGIPPFSTGPYGSRHAPPPMHYAPASAHGPYAPPPPSTYPPPPSFGMTPPNYVPPVPAPSVVSSSIHLGSRQNSRQNWGM